MIWLDSATATAVVINPTAMEMAAPGTDAAGTLYVANIGDGTLTTVDTRSGNTTTLWPVVPLWTPGTRALPSRL